MKTVIENLEKMRDNTIAQMNSLIASFRASGLEATTEPATEEEAPQVVAEAPAATHAVTSNGEAKARKGWRGGVNKSELIRDYFRKHGTDARPRDVIKHILETHKITVAAPMVTVVRDKMVSNKPRKAVEKALKQTKVKVKASNKTADLSGLPMTALCVESLRSAKSRDGLKLAELTDLVIKSGYKYKGSKGRDGVVQNVYQALHNLMKKSAHPGFEGKVAVILKDEASHRYKLNPKAKRKVA
jgi:pyruvate/2-oxoglutarate dehydrogenase complex dihydrolipoamide acyltransferase (E2) component